MARAGLCFGSFNPVHSGHLKIGEYFHRCENLQEIWYILSPQSPFKMGTDLAPPALRLRMLEVAILTQPFSRLIDIEMGMSPPHYTALTLERLCREYPEWEFYLIMGEDNHHSLKEWYRGEWILENFKILVYPRSSMPADTHPPHINISASEIRNRIRMGKPISGLVPAEVERIILKENLYSL